MLIRWFAISTLVTACAGVSEERVAALEAQMAEMQGGMPAGGEAASALEARLANVEVNTNESLNKMGEMLEVLQREVTSWADKQGAATPGASTNGAHGDVWVAVDAMLGLDNSVVQDGDTFSVRRAWLVSQVRTMAATGRGPKVTASKRGVVIRGVRPKSAADRLGLKNNDVVVSVGETQVATLEDLSTALKSVQKGTVVKIMRRKKELLLTYQITE